MPSHPTQPKIQVLHSALQSSQFGTIMHTSLTPEAVATYSPACQAIFAMPIYGNAHFDMPIFTAIDFFARDAANPAAERAALLRHSAVNVMGLEGDMAGDNLSNEEILFEEVGY